MPQMKLSITRPDRSWMVIFCLAVLVLLIHVLTAGNYELHRDAYLYIAQGDHPAFGYWSVPPLTAWLSKIFRIVFGESSVAIRLLPALIGSASVIVIAAAVRTLGGKLPAILLATFSFIFSIAYLRSNTLLQPVSLDQFFWLLTFFVLIKLLKTGNTRYWILLAVVLGFGFLTKYSIVFLAAGIVPAFLLSGQRKLLWHRDVLIALVTGLVIISPNVWWQYQHNWVVLYHMALLKKYQLVHVSIPGFFLAVILMNLNAFIVWLAGLGFLLFHKDFRSYRPLGITWVIAMGIILFLHGKAYYTLGLYTILFSFGAVEFEKYFWNRYRWLFYANLIAIPLILLPVLPLALPVLSFKNLKSYCDKLKAIGLDAPMVWENGKVYDIPQDYADMTGWKELVEIVIKTYNSLDKNQQQHTVIYAENYGQAGAIHFYGKKKGLPDPVSFNGSFIFWAPDSLAGLKYLIYVNDETKDVERLFNNVVKKGAVQDPYFREGRLPVFLCSDPKDPSNRFYRNIVEPIKNQFIRNYR